MSKPTDECREALRSIRETYEVAKDLKLDKRTAPNEGGYRAPDGVLYPAHCAYCAEVEFLRDIYCVGQATGVVNSALDALEEYDAEHNPEPDPELVSGVPEAPVIDLGVILGLHPELANDTVAISLLEGILSGLTPYMTAKAVGAPLNRTIDSIYSRARRMHEIIQTARHGNVDDFVMAIATGVPTDVPELRAARVRGGLKLNGIEFEERTFVRITRID